MEILRNESFAKDKASAKEHLQHLASQSQRDGLRLALFRAQSEYQKRQELVIQELMRWGANPQKVNYEGKSPSEIAQILHDETLLDPN